MKIKTVDYQILKQNIENVIEKNGINRLKNHYNVLINAPNIKNADIRFVWDVFYSIPLEKRAQIGFDLYKYLNDEHIEVTLQNILKNILNHIKNN